MKTHAITTYAFSELSDDAKETALDNLRDINVDYPDWHEFTLDDAKECARILGIEIDDIYYTGFCSQGDGACFTGSYYYAKGAAKKIRQHAPQEAELHRIADELQTIQRRHFYQISASVRHTGHYSHSGSTSIDVDFGERDSLQDAEDDICELLRDFMHWIYRRLESEYEYLTSDEVVRETIEANEYEFTESGKLY